MRRLHSALAHGARRALAALALSDAASRSATDPAAPLQIQTPELAWKWRAEEPAAITAVTTGAADGSHLVGTADGTVSCYDEGGRLVWSSEHRGMTVTGLSTSSQSPVTLVLVSPAPKGVKHGFSSARLLDEDGNTRWQALGAAAGSPVHGRLSLDGETVLLLSAGSPSPATVAVRATSTGAVHWERRIHDVSRIVGDASADLRSIVVGYAARRSDQPRSSGVIESYLDGQVVSSLPHGSPAFPALMGTDRLVVANAHGSLTCRTWTDAAIGTAHWSAAAAPGTLVTGGDRLALCTHSEEPGDATITRVTTIRVFTSDGATLLHKEVRASVPYRATLSSDGRLLALIPQPPTQEETAIVIHLEDPARTVMLPGSVTAIDFGAGAGCMLVGSSDGSVGVACIPD